MTDDKPAPLRGVIAFAKAVTVLFGISISYTFANAFAGRLQDNWLRQFSGDLFWVPYLSIAFLNGWRTDTSQERAAVIRYARWILWLAVAVVCLDFAWFGPWADGVGGVIAPRWRHGVYLASSVVWLILLRGQALTAWISRGQAPAHGQHN